MQTLPISKIVPDENQPRKYFNAEKIKTLKNSIKQYGIMNPLKVQEFGKDKYLLEDGERRFRAATELGLKEVPVIIVKATNDVERLVRQFNIQEQHEAWSPVEKAVAISNLSSKMSLTLAAVCKLLNIADSDQRNIAAFAALLTKDSWVRHEIPISYASPVRGLTNLCVALYEHELEKEFTKDMVKKLETKICTLIIKGNVVKRQEITKLRDAFKKDPKSIARFLANAEATPLSMFVETKARGTYHLRNVVQNGRWLCGHAARYLESRDVRPSAEDVQLLRRTIRDCNLVISQAK